jgi:Tfp pilus assembly protein PilN
VPRVNLLPQEIIDGRRFRGVQRLLAGVVVVVVALCAGATLWARSGVTSAQNALQITRNQTRDLQQQQTRYAEVPKVNAELELARAARERALGADVLWYRFLTDLAVNTPEGTVLSSVTVTMTGATTAVTTGADPLSAAGLGTVKVSGQARRFTDVAAWLDAAGKVNGLTSTQLQSAARSGGDSAGAESKVTYAGSAVVTTTALSHRYDRRAS